MAKIKWIKLSIDMFDDEKIRLIESMPEADTVLVIWIKLLAQAGKTNASGYIYLAENIPYTEEMLATLFNRPLNTVRMALNILQKFKMIRIDSDEYIKVENWEKHQNVDAMERVRENTRKRVEKHRIAKKMLQAPTQDAEPSQDTPPSPNPPKRTGKRVYIEGDVELELSKHLYNKMLENNPDAKAPNFQVWADHIRLMIERDNRKPEQIRNMIDWCQNNSFWKSNILSTKKLRDRYDQLKVKALQEYGQNNGRGTSGGANNRQQRNEDVFNNILNGGDLLEIRGNSNGDEGNNQLL